MPDPGWLLSQLSNPRNVFDILVVALIIYWLLWVAQGTRATQLIRGIVTLLAVVFLVGTTFQLTALNWVLGQTWPVLLISLPVIFQPEIRRALEQLGQTRSWLPQLLPRPDDRGVLARNVGRRREHLNRPLIQQPLKAQVLDTKGTPVILRPRRSKRFRRFPVRFRESRRDFRRWRRRLVR